MPNKIEMTKEQLLLYNELKKLSKRANQRIVRLEREFGKNTWATRILKEKLESEPIQAWTSTGRIKLNKRMTIPQMKATIKATKDFLKNKTSTRRGIKQAKKKAIETLKTRFSTDVSDITIEEAEALTNLFDDKDVNSITNYIKGSDVLTIIEEARESNYSYENFYNTMTAYLQYNKGKGNIENVIRKIYSKYIFKGNKNIEDINLFYDNIENSIDLANTQEELNELAGIIDSLLAENKISISEHNYLINKINDKYLNI